MQQNLRFITPCVLTTKFIKQEMWLKILQLLSWVKGLMLLTTGDIIHIYCLRVITFPYNPSAFVIFSIKCTKQHLSTKWKAKEKERKHPIKLALTTCNTSNLCGKLFCYISRGIYEKWNFFSLHLSLFLLFCPDVEVVPKTVTNDGFRPPKEIPTFKILQAEKIASYKKNKTIKNISQTF